MTPRTGSRVVSFGFLLVLVAIVGAAVVLADRAQEAVLESQSGSVSAAALDPTAPGFRAFTEPTPTALVLHTTIDRGRPALTGLTFMAGADADAGGTVITFPSTYVAPNERDRELGELFAEDGFDAVVDELHAIIGSGFEDVVVLDAASWTALMTDDLPLELSLREDLVAVDASGGREVLVESGTRAFELTEVAVIAGHRNPGDTSLELARRQQQIWQAWISQTASIEERPELFDVDDGFVRLIGILASGEVSYRIAPNRSLVDVGGNTQYLAERSALDELVAQIVVFPSAIPGVSRPSVMVLDGTGGAYDQRSVLRHVVQAGGQVAILGNAASTSEPRSVVQLHDSEARETADAIAELLATGAPELVPLDEATVAVTVIVGVDLVDGQ